MRNDRFHITARNSASCHVCWTSPWSNGASWVFINGRHSRGPIYAQTAQRAVKIPFGLADVVCLEIHDFPDDTVVPDAIEIKPNTRPLIAWNAVPGAVRYRIYHSVRGGSESLLYDRAAITGIENYEINCPVTLDGRGGVWHFLRVEAVDRYGNESVRTCMTYFATDLPIMPRGVSVTSGSISGTYGFRILDI